VMSFGQIPYLLYTQKMAPIIRRNHNNCISSHSPKSFLLW
jgi:hypothetical protein